jgi:hypothetical protein
VHGELVNSPPALLMTLGAFRLRERGQLDATRLEQIAGFEAAERTRLRHDLQQRPPDIIVTTRYGHDWVAWARVDGELGTILDGYEAFATVPFADYDLELLRRKGLRPTGS